MGFKGFKMTSRGRGGLSKKGFTLVELIMTISIIAVLATAGAFLMVFLVQTNLYIPRQLNMDMMVSDMFETIIEGDARAKGLRFCRQITTANQNRVDFVTQDGDQVFIRFQNAQNRVQRNINGGGWEVIPNYLPASGITLSLIGNRFFVYYDVNENTTNNAANVRRVEARMIAQTGSGSFVQSEGQTQQTSSVKVYPFQ